MLTGLTFVYLCILIANIHASIKYRYMWQRWSPLKAISLALLLCLLGPVGTIAILIVLSRNGGYRA